MLAKPNIITIITDQQRLDSLGCAGSSFVNTPNLNRLAGNGAFFTRAYCSNPVCTPSRASILSGCYVSKHGAWNVGMNVPQDVKFLSHHLHPAGYRTHYVGKAHLNASGGPKDKSLEAQIDEDTVVDGPYYGFETVELTRGHSLRGVTGHYAQWIKQKLGDGLPDEFPAEEKASYNFGGTACEWDMPLELHNSTWVAERSAAFIEEMESSDQPFLLCCGFQDPHHPHALPKEYAAKLEPEKIPLPAYREGELMDKPPHFAMARRGELCISEFRGGFAVAGQGDSPGYEDVTDEEARLGKAYYYGMVELIDQAVGRIISALEKTGQLANTLIIFTTDHGELLGDHGIWMKGPFHYEQIVNVPLIMSWPKHIPQGMVVDEMVSLVDVAPTVLSLCREPIPHSMDGVDLVPMLKGQQNQAREHVLIECIDDPDRLRLKTIVTKQHKLTYYLEKDFGELYDLVEDPEELVNLWSDPDKQQVKIALLKRIIDTQEGLERRAERLSYA